LFGRIPRSSRADYDAMMLAAAYISIERRPQNSRVVFFILVLYILGTANVNSKCYFNLQPEYLDPKSLEYPQRYYSRSLRGIFSLVFFLIHLWEPSRGKPIPLTKQRDAVILGSHPLPVQASMLRQDAFIRRIRTQPSKLFVCCYDSDGKVNGLAHSTADYLARDLASQGISSADLTMFYLVGGITKFASLYPYLLNEKVLILCPYKRSQLCQL
jgi:hypothetical protein